MPGDLPFPGGFLPRTDRYELREPLGAGALGVVYRVLDRETGREVALKTLRAPSPDALYLLKREFRALADILHPNLVRLFDLEADGAHAFFTMELVRGPGLVEHLCGGRGEVAREPGAVREAFGQLAAALAALHRRGKLHRDVKPENVRVEKDTRRVVLLDFGLVIGMQSALSLASQHGALAGTLAYMAPEQAWGQPLTPAADWYATGVLLYECLAGALPFQGPVLGSLLERRDRPPPSPRELVPDASEALSELALDLLAYDPQRRPSAEEVMARLEEAAPGEAPPASRRRPASRAALRESVRAAGGAVQDLAAAHGPVFVGREGDLGLLRSAFADTRRGAGVAVRVVGPSGVGKSTLVARFLTALEQEEGALVLCARCHPQESVRFQAVDGLVDELSRFLSRQPPEQLEAVRPRGLRALERVFPVLGRVPFGERATDPDPSDAEPQEVRRRASAALRELLARLAERTPLALWTDDLHWGDADSALFLRDLLRAPDPPPLLLLLSYRTEERSALLDELTEAARDGGAMVRTLAVEPLDAARSRELLAKLLGERAGDDASIDAVAGLAGGSPFFLAELARAVEERGDLARLGEAPRDLASVIRERVALLPAEARSLLQVVAVSGRPLEMRLALAAAGLEAAERGRVYELCNASLLRASASGRDLEVYHGRIREAVLGGLDAVRLRRRHRELAETLEAQAPPDSEALLDHWLGAGERARAAPHALKAAVDAQRALAFGRAAERYDQAWQLAGGRDTDFALLARRAEALANAGHGARAAEAYTEAGECAARTGAASWVVAGLRGRAAEQHLYAGHLDAGLGVVQKVLRDLGVPIPANPQAALRQALWLRARFLLRGTRFRPRDDGTLPEPAATRLDVLRGASRGASMLDHTLGTALGARALLEALKLGEPSRVLQALGLQAATEANLGGPRRRTRARRFLDEVEALARRTGAPYDAAWAEVARSTTAWFLAEWQACVDHGARAEAVLREHCIGVNWDLDSNRAFILSALGQLGRIRELSDRLPELVEEARRRGSRYALQVYRTGDSILVPLARDDVDGAVHEMETWGDAWREGLFTSPHFVHLYASVHLHLYRGDAWAALRATETSWRALRSAGFLYLDCIGNLLRHGRARAALAACAAGGPPRELSRLTPPRLLRLAGREARAMARSSLPHALPLVRATEAGLAAAREDDVAASHLLAEAAVEFDRAQMSLHAEAARFQRGRLLGGDAAHDREAAETWMRGEGIARPAAMAEMLVPLPGIGGGPTNA